MKKHLKYILFLILPFAISAGELDDLRKMNKVYLEASSFSMKVSVATYRNAKDSKAFFTYAGKMKKSGTAFFSEINGHATINNKSYSLLIDDNNKVVVVGKAIGGKKKDHFLQFIMNDSLFSGGFIYKFLVNTAGKKIIEVRAKDPALWENIKMEVTLNTENYTIEEIVMYPKTKTGQGEENSFEKVVIRYEQVEVDAAIPEKDFSEENFVTISKNSITAKGKYAKYKVIDQVHVGKK